MTRTPHNDEPDIDLNLFPERQRLLQKLVHDIRECTPPMVFGVHGDWGAGKTSFLQAAMHALTGSCPIQKDNQTVSPSTNYTNTELNKQIAKWHKNPPLAVWFESWRYQNESAPVIALLHELREALTWHTHPLSKVKNALKTSALVSWKNTLLALDSIMVKIEGEVGAPLAGAKSSVNFKPFNYSKVSEDLAKSRLSTPLPSNQLREALDNILSNLLQGAKDTNIPKPNHRVVIFIDDLDRCSASSMFSLLESIKIYLNLRHCVFVLGINRHELERGIASILPEPLVEDQRQIRAHEYLEKLCGNIIRLPFPSKSSQRLMLRNWLRLDKVNKDNKFLEAVADLAVKYTPIPLNPRRIKMWCNTILLMYEHRIAKLTRLPNGDYPPPPTTESPAIVLLACLYTFYPALHQAMEACEEVSFILTLKQWCQAEKISDLVIFDGIRRIFTMRSLLEKFEKERQDTSEQRGTEVIRRFYIQAPSGENDEKNPVPEHPKPLPLLVDPSSLQYFHPQRLVSEEEFRISHLKSYLYID